MSDNAGDKTRVIFETSPTIRRAIRLRAAKGDATTSVSDVVNEALTAALATEIEEITRLSGTQTTQPQNEPKGDA
jgi:hypothetical protein